MWQHTTKFMHKFYIHQGEYSLVEPSGTPQERPVSERYLSSHKRNPRSATFINLIGRSPRRRPLKDEAATNYSRLLPSPTPNVSRREGGV
jgi:hypothetical protein